MRELHDLLGHNLSFINVQAGVALNLTQQQPEQVYWRTRCITVKQVSQEALIELRSFLEHPAPGRRGRAPRSPSATLARLSDLVLRAAAAPGLAARAETECGVPRTLPFEC